MKKVILVVAAAILAAATASAAPRDFVLEAKGPLAQGHINAVRLAGGTVNFQHAGTGLVMASSENAGFAAQMTASGLFSSATPDRVVQWTPDVHDQGLVEAAITPDNETFWNAQWAPRAIHAPEAWAAGCTGTGVRVAILDGGIHSTHLDLDGRLDVAASRSFVPGFAFNQDTGHLLARHPRGRHRRRGGQRHRHVGIAPEATLIGVKVLHSGSGAFSWVISGILYAATPIAQGGGGADIINMSLGALFSRATPTVADLVAAMNKAVNYADRYGVLVVSSAGNDASTSTTPGTTSPLPAQSGSGIAVSATGPMGFGRIGADELPPAGVLHELRQLGDQRRGPGGDFALPGNELCTIPRIPSGSVTDPVLGLRHGYQHRPWKWRRASQRTPGRRAPAWRPRRPRAWRRSSRALTPASLSAR